MAKLTYFCFVVIVLAQYHTCLTKQPLPKNFQEEPTKLDNTSNILSLINNTAKCPALAFLLSNLSSKFNSLSVCDRPVPQVKMFNSYDTILCMVLYDAARRACEVKNGVDIPKQNLSSNNICDAMNKTVPESSFNDTRRWVSLLKDEFKNSTKCEGACIQDEFVNPLCLYIVWANTPITDAQVPPTTTTEISSGGNSESHLNMKITGGGVETNIDRNKAPEKTSVETASADGPEHPKQKNESTNKDHAAMDQITRKASDSKSVHNRTEANASSSSKSVHNHIEANASSTSLSVKDMEVHAKNSVHSKSNNKPSGKVTDYNSIVPHQREDKLQPESKTQEGSSGKAASSDSVGIAAPAAENKNSARVDPSNQEIKIDDDDPEVNHNVPQDEEMADDSQDGEHHEQNEVLPVAEGKQVSKKTENQQEEARNDNTAQFNQLGDAEDSHFYAYFMTMVVICIIGYLVFHNKQKILALALEGRSRRGTRRRPNTSAYRKLDSNLEEAVTSACSTSVTHVIY